jgi:hypothetical protein
LLLAAMAKMATKARSPTARLIKIHSMLLNNRDLGACHQAICPRPVAPPAAIWRVVRTRSLAGYGESGKVRSGVGVRSGRTDVG